MTVLVRLISHTFTMRPNSYHHCSRQHGPRLEQVGRIFLSKAAQTHASLKRSLKLQLFKAFLWMPHVQQLTTESILKHNPELNSAVPQIFLNDQIY